MYNQWKSCRSAILVFLTHKMALPILKIIRKPEIFPYTLEQLTAFKKGTLGNDLSAFIQNNKLELLAYYARHDIKHILLDYETTDEGEGNLQCFMLGNGHLSFPVVATVVYCFLTMPEYWKSFRNAYERGRKAVSISNWEWFRILEVPTNDLRNKIHTASKLSPCD